MFEEAGFTGSVEVVDLEDLDITAPSGEGLEAVVHFDLFSHRPLSICVFPLDIRNVSPLSPGRFFRKLKLVYEKLRASASKTRDPKNSKKWNLES